VRVRAIPVRRPAAARAGLGLLVAMIVAVAAAVGPTETLGRTPASAASAGARSSSAPGELRAAHTFLRLTNERLAMMKAVMEIKWLSRSPIQDRAQEARVVQDALAMSAKLGLADAGVRRVFTQEILAAKEVQLGWGARWLWSGFPKDITPPSLDQLRAHIAALTPKLIDALAGLGQLRCQAGVRATLTRASHRLIPTTYVSDRRKATIVAALLSVRHLGASCQG
jgi:chorismate mutase-like protein